MSGMFFQFKVSLITTFFAFAGTNSIADEVERAINEQASAAFEAGVNHYESGQLDKAIEQFSIAIEKAPQSLDAYVQRANVLMEKGQFKLAIDDLTRAIEIKPHFHLYFDRAVARWRTEDFAGAILDAETAVARDTLSSPDTHLLLARIYSAAPDENVRNAKAAIEHAHFAQRLVQKRERKDTPSVLMALAMAYAESGDFEKAVEYQERANRMIPRDLPQSMSTRLKLYQDKKAYRDSFEN